MGSVAKVNPREWDHNSPPRFAVGKSGLYHRPSSKRPAIVSRECCADLLQATSLGDGKRQLLWSLEPVML